MTTVIWVTAEIPGFHRWDGAPESVSFLRNEHRHLFKFKMTVSVFHSDRNIEFFTLKKELYHYLEATFGSPANFEGKSCEMIAKAVHTYFHKDYVVVSVEVSEDGENGAIVYE